MNCLTSCLTATALITAFATVSAQNAVADSRAGTSDAAESGQQNSRSDGSVRAPRSASTAQGRVVEDRSGRGAGVPSEQGTMRGGPENPSGLKKPD
ncbi:hypothetical protein LMG28614_04785 [Paraburkholderia ultramafica]|uniref:Uncharacterized protein n=1 Tax=Paraburkholderia ultramafica TaxID=1544867 RepID=A0A6S7BG70_9BURK|nr:hypothetical protein LMG28614_04785 [Paraburkholderia ultramafica]